MDSKAQTLYIDFTIGLLLFTFTLIAYINYTNNFQNDEGSGLDIMLTDAKAISSSLTLSGYPSNWDNATVIRIGIADEQRVNSTKLNYFKHLNYTNTKTKFGTIYDYFIFFINDNGEILNMHGVCGIGHPLINLTYNLNSAYYYKLDSDSFLKDFMIQTFKADVYKDDIASLSSNINKYQFLVIEHPLLTGSEIGAYKGMLESFSSKGGSLMISGELAAPSTNNMVGVVFNKKNGQSSSQRTAIVNNTDKYLSLTVGQSMLFNQYFYVENDTSSSVPALELKAIAAFNQTDDKAIAKWIYGNGTVYFFSDFDVSFFSGGSIKIVENLAKSFIEGTCNPINLTNIKIDKLVKTERYLSYNSKIVKMIAYVWK